MCISFEFIWGTWSDWSRFSSSLCIDLIVSTQLSNFFTIPSTYSNPATKTKNTNLKFNNTYGVL